VHALRQIHRALAPGGILLDMHPVPPATRAEVGGVSLGDFDDAEFFEIVRATEKPLAESDLFVLDEEVEFDYLERWDSGEQLLEDVSDWEGCRVPPRVAKAIREAKPPVDIWERVVLRRFRASRSPR
jgi:SAM-dependent methyltransferase